MKIRFNSKTESFDETIARFKGNFDEAPNETLKKFWQEQIHDMSIQKDVSIKATEEIIKALIKRTIKEIILCYPDLLTWEEESRFFQLQITKGLFVSDMINEFGKEVQSISVTCNDGIVRIFDIKIEAFYGYMSERNQTLMNFVKVYFALRDPS